MNGRKAKLLRHAAYARATQHGRLGYIEREVEYNSVDRHGKPQRKKRKCIQLMYQPMSGRAIYQRMKRAYTRRREVRLAFVGA